jgi:hypothetical protein
MSAWVKLNSNNAHAVFPGKSGNKFDKKGG